MVPASDKIEGYLADLRGSIQSMHCSVANQKMKQRLLNDNKERVDKKRGNKLQIGPYRVIRADIHSFRVEHLVPGEELDVHASRFKFYSDGSLDVTDELLEHISSQGIVLSVDRLKEHKWNIAINDFEILVEWKGFQPIEVSYDRMATSTRKFACC
ncbi:LOW QUALITY PROTEIN: Hypothetical protein PHPALM_9350 [Phytophthora palmivora]|uniref:Chromo domain-containing protein n=1 Tax=Phytophthora palmivora TaxID=4796 RepID=A0A2P4Y7I4_9STRA|nr:LOW QUALITY PROTEIN: Hypothetical protein PHPALM_9350 [Phytophthora palmivora]